MTCQQCRAALLAYLDDSLTPRQRGDVEAHLATCAACRAALDQWRAIGAATVQAHTLLTPASNAPQHRWADIAAQLHAPYTSPAKGSPMTFDSPLPTPLAAPARRRRGLVPIAALVLAIIVVASLAAWRIGIAQSAPAAHPLILFTDITDERGSVLYDLVSAINPATGGLQWRRQVTVDRRFLPQYLGDRLFVTTDVDAAFVATVEALRVSDGGVLWQQRFAQPTVTTTPETTYIADNPRGQGETQVGKRFLALDNATGKARWDVTVIFSSPALAPYYKPEAFYHTNDTVVVSGSLLFKGYSAFLIGLDAATGDAKWQTIIPNTLAGVTNGGNPLRKVATIGNTIVLTFPTQTLAYDAATGALLWTLPHGGDVTTDGTTLFINDVPSCVSCSFTPPITNTLYAVRPADGAIIWQHPWVAQNGRANVGTEISNGVLIGSDAYAHQIIAFDATTGAVLWQRPADLEQDFAHGDIVYVLDGPSPPPTTNTGYATTLSALDLRSGAARWQRHFNGTTQPRLSAVVYRSDVVLGLATSYPTTSLYAFRPSDGSQLWHITPSGSFDFLPYPYNPN